MATFRFLTGQYANILQERIDAALFSGRVTGISGGALDEDTKFPRANLVDDSPSQPFRFATASVQDIVVDLNQVPNGGFESAFIASLPYSSAWGTNGLGTATRDTVVKNTGAASMKIETTTVSLSTRFVDLKARAGEKWRFTGAGRADGDSKAKIYIQNLATGFYLQADGTWAASIAYLVNTTSTSFVTFAISSTVEAFAQARSDVVTIRVSCEASDNDTIGTSAANFDDIFCWPGFDFMGVFGHSIPAAVTPDFRSGTTNAVTTSQGTMTLRQPSFYKVLAAVEQTHRYVGLRLGTLPPDGVAIWLGELVVGQTTTLLKNPRYPLVTDYDHPQVRQSTIVGAERVAALSGGDGPRSLRLRKYCQSTAQFQQLRDDLIRRSRGGLYPIIAIPDDADDQVCIFGRIPGRVGISQDFVNLWTGDLSIVEQPGPTFVA